MAKAKRRQSSTTVKFLQLAVAFARISVKKTLISQLSQHFNVVHLFVRYLVVLYFAIRKFVAVRSAILQRFQNTYKGTLNTVTIKET